MFEAWRTSADNDEHAMKTRDWNAARGIVLLDIAVFRPGAVVQEDDQKGVAVHDPNLLLNQAEIDQIKLKVRENAWAARLLDRVKAKAEKDGAAVEAALAYVLTGQTHYARSVRNRLMNEAREYMRHF